MKKKVLLMVPWILVFFGVLFLFGCKKEESNQVQSSYAISMPLAEKAGLNFAKALSIGDSTSKITQRKLYISGTDTLMYYFQVDDSTSILISGDKRLFPLMGYSTSRDEYNNQSPEFDCFMQTYLEQITLLRKSDIKSVDSLSIIYWDAIYLNKAAYFTYCYESEILIPNNNWKQSTPFNDYGYDIGSSHGLVGCGPLAMSMICKYYQYPEATSGVLSYTTYSGHSFTHDITDVYDYANIPWYLYANSGNTKIVETNELMLHAGIALHADYGTTGTGVSFMHSSTSTGSVPDDITTGLATFGYTNTSNLCRNANTESNWTNTIITHLMAKHPIIYVGVTPSNAGHAWICDRYKTWLGHISMNNTYPLKMFNMKWGWGNNTNSSYYTLGNLTPMAGYTFSKYNKIYVPVKP